MIRLTPDHAARVTRSKVVSFTFDGQPVAAREGESIVSALLRAGILHLRDAPNGGGARGAFCCMGLCQECAVQVDGCVVEACRYDVVAGLTVVSM